MGNALLITLIAESVSFISVIIVLFYKIGQYKKTIDFLEEEKTRSILKIELLRTDVDALKEFKINAQKFIDSNLYQAKIILQLTQIGRELVENSGFIEIFERVKDDLVKILNEEKAPVTKYDVQEKSRALMDELINHEYFIPIKTYAYNSGKDAGQILRAGAILLRDYYLLIHPEIKN